MFCKTFIYSISLILELAGSDLVQTLTAQFLKSYGISHFYCLLFLQIQKKDLTV